MQSCRWTHSRLVPALSWLLITSQQVPSFNPGQAACLCTEELIKFNKAPTKFNEALAKTYHGLIEILHFTTN